MPRLLPASGVVIACVALLLFACRAPLSLRLFEIGFKRNLQADPIGEFEDGLHVVLCGAGGPLPDPERTGPCAAVIAGKSLFIVDAGTGAARNIGTSGLGPGNVEAVFLTHFHSDHIDGLGELATLRWAQGGHKAPLPVVGPAGVGEITGGFNRAYAFDQRYRTAHHGDATVPASGGGLEPRAFALPPAGEAAVVWEADDLRVTAFAVEHAPVRPAVGYRFDYKGRSLLLSGDTSKSANLQHFAQDVDLLIHEALSARIVGVGQAAAEEVGVAGMAKILSDIPDYHATPVEAAEVAEAAGAGHLLYYHVVPPLPIPGLASVFLEGTDDAYSGGITLGVNGTTVSLPAGSDAIEVGSL